MIIKIDTDLKTINIESSIKLKDLIIFLENNIKGWEEYTIIATTISYSYPIIYQPTKPWEPYDPPYKITCINNGTGGISIMETQYPTFTSKSNI